MVIKSGKNDQFANDKKTQAKGPNNTTGLKQRYNQNYKA